MKKWGHKKGTKGQGASTQRTPKSYQQPPLHDIDGHKQAQADDDNLKTPWCPENAPFNRHLSQLCARSTRCCHLTSTSLLATPRRSPTLPTVQRARHQCNSAPMSHLSSLLSTQSQQGVQYTTLEAQLRRACARQGVLL